MEAAPTFRFEGEQRVTTPLEGEMDVRHTGEASGDVFVFLTESMDETSPRQGGVSYLGGKAYSSDGRYSLPGDVMQPLTETPRSLLLPPEELVNAAVREETEGGARVWVLTAERLLNKFEGTAIRTSIEPLQTHCRVVDPATLRVLRWESETDFGTITDPAESGIESGTQRRAASCASTITTQISSSGHHW
jgi:hypothetical protein